MIRDATRRARCYSPPRIRFQYTKEGALMGIKRFGPVMVVCAALLALPALALAYNHPMHGGEKAPAVNAAVYANQGFYPSRYVIQHCTDAFEGTGRWWRWAVVFTDPKAYHNPLCDSVSLLGHRHVRAGARRLLETATDDQRECESLRRSQAPLGHAHKHL